MKQLVEFPLEDGSTILIEVDELGYEGSITKASRSGDLIAKASQTLEQALEVVRPAACAIHKKLRDLHEQPDEIEVEFGLKLSVEAGAFVAAAGMDANYTITLKWKKTEVPKLPEKS
jgi:hypothetical protein